MGIRAVMLCYVWDFSSVLRGEEEWAPQGDKKVGDT